VIFLGHGLFELPRQVFISADPRRRLKVQLNALNILAEETARAAANAWIALQACRKLCESSAHTRLNADVVHLAEERAHQLEPLSRIHTLPRFFYESQKAQEPYISLCRRDLRYADSATVEEFLALCDNCVVDLESGYHNITAMIDVVEPTMQMVVHHSKGRTFARADKILRILLAIVMILLNLVIGWSEIVVIFNEQRYGGVALLAKLAIITPVKQLFIIAPFVGYVIFVCGWSLSKMKMGRQAYRFVPHATNEKALFWWTVHVTRLASALAGNLILAADAKEDSIFWKSVFTHLEKFPGATQFDQFIVIGVFVVLILVAVHVWEMGVEAVHCSRLHFDTEDVSMREMGQGMEIARSLRPRLATLIETDEVKSMAQDGPLLSTLQSAIY
jgi:hypothetical protein